MRILVIQPDPIAYSETFIQAHVDRLAGEVVVLSGVGVPRYRESQGGVAKKIAHATMGALETAALRTHLSFKPVDVVLAEYGTTGAVLAPICERHRVPLVVHFHGFDAYRHATLERHRDDYLRMFEIAEALVVVSKDMQRQLLSLGAPEDKLRLNPYGVDLSRFSDADPAQSNPTLLAVGRFVDKKAPHLTILAFERVAAEVAAARLLMIGDGPLLESCRQLAAGLGIEHQVELLGARTPQEVAAAMRAARGFVQHSVRPSHGDSEGTPVGILEASASALPVVATRHAGIPDAVIDGETGLLVAEGDVAGMAESMRRLVDDPTLAATLGAAGRQRMSEHFRIEDRIAALDEILRIAV